MWEREGQGWRLAWDPQRDPFPFLIGGEGWASELTLAEGQALCQALDQVHDQHQALVDSLMEEETICLEFTGPVGDGQSGPAGDLWLGLEGDRRDWTLRLVLQPAAGQRGLEGFWARGAAVAFARACAALEGAAARAPECPGP